MVCLVLREREVRVRDMQIIPGIVLGIIGLTAMPEHCWHNKDIFLPKLAIIICCPIIYKYIDHKAVIILCYLD